MVKSDQWSLNIIPYFLIPYIRTLWKCGMMFRFLVDMIGEGGDYGDEGQNDDKAG